MERDALVTQSEVDNFRQRLSEKSSTYHSAMTAIRLNNINFIAEVEALAYSPFVRLHLESTEILHNDIVSFAQSQSVSTVDVFLNITKDIPAIKIDEKFINLISMEEIEFKDGNLINKQAYMQISFWPKIESDL